MNGIYECSVIHNRVRPKKHRFGFKLFWVLVDLDHLEELTRSPLVSYNRFNLFSFWDIDHSYQKEPISARENIEKYLRSQGVTTKIKKVLLLTNLRILGYVFNPVSYYFIEDENGRRYSVIEICNTFKEIKPYYVSPKHYDGKNFDITTIKNFYISPFTEHNNTMRFKYNWPNEAINVAISDFEQENLIMTTTLKGRLGKYSTGRLVKLFFKYPLLTFAITFFIHWHALILYLKGLPFKKKDEDQIHQQGALPWRQRQH